MDTRRLAHAMTMRLFPVKSSAPPTTTRIRPRLNATPASTRMAPQGAVPAPASAVVAKTPPERDEGAGEDGQREGRGGVHGDLPDADVLGPGRHLGGQERIEVREAV